MSAISADHVDKLVFMIIFGSLVFKHHTCAIFAVGSQIVSFWASAIVTTNKIKT